MFEEVQSMVHSEMLRQQSLKALLPMLMLSQMNGQSGMEEFPMVRFFLRSMRSMGSSDDESQEEETEDSGKQLSPIGVNTLYRANNVDRKGRQVHIVKHCSDGFCQMRIYQIISHTD